MSETMINAQTLAEIIANYAAESFLSQYLNPDIFIGSEIETILGEQTTLIYQNVDDSSYSGAAILYQGHSFVALNTHQSLRNRYFSAAHELWHLCITSDLLGTSADILRDQAKRTGFDTERAADHFAAAILMPQNAIRLSWHKLVRESDDDGQLKRAVIRIANVAAVPYVAVARRLSELGLLDNPKIVKLTEKKWQDFLATTDFPLSPLDQPVIFEKFAAFAHLTDDLVEKGQLSLMEAANLMTNVEPERAKQYLVQHRQSADLDDD
ncbi:ImmA/IrrE family metallo-endopeptidase [Secundilactobacillus paracollinoides]|uniref:ImmA/IrrE family metallo-endopeptidase n=1 Tax=Secundilactobacillus paracollinoides TaxID=240427 RepID=UPI0006EE9948|nr:ImmA/IrrE family metallo-endopeptidase [Secundilactobacillus paracollinoides]KRL75564.1 hypothetical protein FC17_GL002622 [Secundilactobacillus paracollinoides DSM 15502 = JCM 11969]